MKKYALSHSFNVHALQSNGTQGQIISSILAFLLQDFS